MGGTLEPDVQGNPLTARTDAATAALETRIGYSFTDRKLLERALSHASHPAGPRARLDSYERLEFLGDRVLALIIAKELYHRYPDAHEGELARSLAQLVRIEACAAAATAIDLGAALRLGKGERKLRLDSKTAVLGDAFEALLGALYIEAGYETAERLVLRLWEQGIGSKTQRGADAKTLLQEWAHSLGLPEPVYSDAGRTGPEHRPVFTVRALVRGFVETEGTGPTKRAAEQAAAEAMLTREGARGDAA